MARRAVPITTSPRPPSSQQAERRRLGDVDVVADVLQISVRSVWRRVADGTLPRPISLGRAKRWDLDGLNAWIAAHGESR